MRGSFRLGLGVGLAGVVTVAGALLGACGGSSGNGGFDGGGTKPESGVHDGGVDTTVQTDTGPPDVINFGDQHISGEGGDTSPIPATCADSLERHSYIGCDYWPTVTVNPVYSSFDYAVAVSNPQTGPATIMVSGGALAVAIEVMIPASSIQTINLPWVPALKGPDFAQNTAVSDPGPSRIVVGGAYHLTSNVPVSVYQFNALEYEIDAGPPCPGYGDSGAGPHCYSYSNDASLLLPTNVLTGNYGVLAWPSFGATPGFMSVTATANGTNVTVYPTGRVQGVPDAGPPYMSRGEHYTYSLNQGDVLEMFSDVGDINDPVYNQDLSGTIIEADQPVMAFGGHYCTYIPYDKKACDHLETSLFPIETLGTEYIVSLPHTPHGEHEWVRILGLFENTKVAFDPPVSGYSGAILNTGDILELDNVASSFAILANGKIFVTQYMLGEYDTVPDGGTPVPDLGDPSESAAITLTQYRSSYTFLAPQTYDENWIDVLAPMGATVSLDGVAISSSSYTQVGSQPFAVAHQLLASSGSGGHSIESSVPFGLVVYGYGSRTSYMYPGGLDLRVVNVMPPPLPK
jgi:IgGFc binding protein